MVSVDQLKDYRWSSVWYLFNKRKRPAFLDCSGALACLIKIKTSATNVWITQQLNMGTPDAVSRYVSEFRNAGGAKKQPFKELTTKVMT